MKTITKVLGISFFALAMTASFQNCGKVNFTASPSVSNSQNNPDGILSGTPCTLQNSSTNVNLKIIFMVDNSGSTAQTDPQQYYRILAVQDLITQYKSVTTFNYSYGYFAGTTSSIYDDSSMKFVTPSKVVTPFGPVADLSNALSAFEKVGIGGNTPYQAAFAGLQSAIDADQALGNAGSWAYAIVFMSDGMPTDLNGNIPQDIIALVDQLRTNIQSGGSSSTVSAVYFGPDSDAGSITNLQTMATEGQGQFVDTNATPNNLNFANVITVPGTNCPTP